MGLNKIVAFAANALSFVFLDKQLFGKIKNVYLFGSAVRHELGPESDIDLFVDCEAKDEDFVRKGFEAGLQTFYSSRDYEKWRLLGLKNKFSVHAGNLEEWELKSSVLAEGLLLYGTPKVLKAKGERKVFFVISLPKQKAKYLRLKRQLEGRKEKYLKTKGLLEELKGTKLGPNVYAIPKEHQKQLMEFFEANKIKYRMIEAFVLG